MQFIDNETKKLLTKEDRAEVNTRFSAMSSATQASNGTPRPFPVGLILKPNECLLLKLIY